MISTDSTPTTAPRPSTTGPYWVSERSRSESASRSTSSSSRIGSGEVSGRSATVSLRHVALRHPAAAGGPRRRRPAGYGRSASAIAARARSVGSPTRTSGAFHRSMSRTRSSESRFSARSAPTKSSTNSSAGFISSSSGVAYWARTPPFRSTATRSPILIASSMSWVTNTIVLRISDWRRRNWFCRRSRLIGSIAPNGSSISISGGSAASARATPDALALPAGQLRRVAVAQLGAERGQLEQLVDPSLHLFLVPAEQLRHDRDVLADREVREQADLLDHVADPAPQLGRGARADALAVDQDVALGQLDHAVREPQRGGLAAAGRTDQHADLAGRHGQREVVDRGLGLARIALDDVAVLDRGGGRAGGRGAVPCHARMLLARPHAPRLPRQAAIREAARDHGLRTRGSVAASQRRERTGVAAADPQQHRRAVHGCRRDSAQVPREHVCQARGTGRPGNAARRRDTRDPQAQRPRVVATRAR